MKVTVVGGGNIGMCLAGEISRLREYQVTLYTSRPDIYDNKYQIEDLEKEITFFSGELDVTNDMKKAIGNAKMIICTYPAHLRKSFVQKITPFVQENTYIGFFPGYGGAEFYCQKLLEKKCTLFALQKVPYVARIKEKGKIAGLWSRKKELYVGTIPREKSREVAAILEDMLLIKCSVLDNYMEATLLPGNPILHTSGSFVYLNDYKKGQIFSEQIFYYRKWDDTCSKVCCMFSDEMIDICNRLPINLSGVQSIQKYYEANTPEKLTKKFHSIPSFYNLKLPMNKVEDGYVPDFSSRFFTEDIPNGVCIIKALAIMMDMKTPVIDEILEWYQRMTGKEYFKANNEYGKDIQETGIPQLSGINRVEELCEFYMR